MKSICLHVLTVFYLTHPSSKQIICLDFKKQDSALPYNILYTLLMGSFWVTDMNYSDIYYRVMLTL